LWWVELPFSAKESVCEYSEKYAIDRQAQFQYDSEAVNTGGVDGGVEDHFASPCLQAAMAAFASRAVHFT
jgi:hypothetical protein